ncbi:hypothetical protein CIW49_19785 [Mycolicibacterium sp. P1-18]|uniref:NACHT domain-containing protein n=1 Tax=Mycolicibacterium sp. P1-18 TaxID=2024615 RepID=UPI0011F3168E|nr:hypothetical protein [Mycolicibacterium sp. P1-18]KAA0096886.1 hypothetical protein CIW49_19785 [Mycolicibacterium sp. P1-18]
MSLNSPVGPYWYENLSEGEFQKLCHVLIANKYDGVTCFPVGQKDGGRDLTQRHVSGDIVYQVKWSKGLVKNPITWLDAAVSGESERIRTQVAAGAARYILMTSVAGTAAVATGPNGYGAGTIDKFDEKLANYAEEYGLDAMECWWRDDIDALVSALPGSVQWRFNRMLAGPEAMRFLLQSDAAEVAEAQLALLIRKAVQAQWWQDVKVKFKQAELDNDDLEDLFVDVKIHPNPTRSVHRFDTGQASGDPVGAAEYLVSSRNPFTLVRGEPGQGKSTLGQYVSQIYRSEFVPDEPSSGIKRPSLKPPASRVPLRIDLRDYASWLEGSDPFAESSLGASVKPRRLGAVERFLVPFLSALAESDDIDLALVNDLLDRFPMLIVLDGLDEVGQRDTRQRVVSEIEKFIGRWRGGSTVPPKILVTTRPNVSDLPEPSAQWFEPVSLLKLDAELRRTYLRKWCAARGIVNRSKRELIHSFDARTAEPHIAQLAENPMQLTILLYLLHLQGHSVPDKRTPLYDSYMNTFLNREAEKSVSVRENRDDLEEVTAYLGWHLQGLAEQQGGAGRVGTTDLKTEIFRYLTGAEKDTSLVDALFTDVTDRVWALASKAQGTFEFDVQPVREFFAAKYLSRYASTDKSEVLKALIRRPFWFNTSRFFAGFAHANEVGGLVDGLTEEIEEARHPLSERVATWTFLADGVFSSKTTAQRRAAELLADDLGTRLLRFKNDSSEPLPTLPSDRGSAMLVQRLLIRAADNPAAVVSEERVSLAAGIAAQEGSLNRWWLDNARSAFGGTNELAWLRLGRPLGAGRLLDAGEVTALNADSITTVATAVEIGIVPPPASSIERTMLNAILAGHCSDVASPRTGFIPDLVNALAPRHFISLAKPEGRGVFEMVSAHSAELMPTLKRQEAFRRLKAQDPRFGKIQEAMNRVRRSTNTIGPWSDAAGLLRGLYGPSWLAADIAVIGAAISPQDRRDLGTMNPLGKPFGPDIDYGRLANDIRQHRNHEQWWLNERDSLEPCDRALWAYALVAVATPTVVEACRSLLEVDISALEPDELGPLMASSSRLGLSHISRRLPWELAASALETSVPVGLLMLHHVDLASARSSLSESVTCDIASAAAAFGPAGWPALDIAGAALIKSESMDWLDVLKTHGPAAVGGVAQGPLPNEICEQVLNDCSRYPLQWVLIAEASRSQLNAESPLLASSGMWFKD